LNSRNLIIQFLEARVKQLQLSVVPITVGAIQQEQQHHQGTKQQQPETGTLAIQIGLAG